MSRPNVLFFMTDQHRADHVGFGGNTIVKTPNLDSIAASGMVFDQAFVANPICMPNRATIMTGRMPSAHGTRHNGITLDWHANTFVKALRRDGYRTSHIGKSHLQNMGVNRRGMLRDVDFSLPEDAVGSDLAPGWNDHENLFAYQSSQTVPVADDFYGFERVNFTVSHGDLCSGHYYQWLLAKGINPKEYQGFHNALARSADYAQVYQTRLPVELYPTTYIADRTIEELGNAAEDQRPFFIHCSFPDPHHPFSPPGKYWDMYQADDMPLPGNFEQDHSRSPSFIQQLIRRRGQPAELAVDPWAPTREQYSQALAAQYGMISLVDDQVGRVLDSLRALNLDHNTIIVFSSDHGDLFGDHGLMMKHYIHYEGCLRVPLVINCPGKPQGRSDALVGSIDLAQTILDLAGVVPYHDMQGLSLASLLDNPDEVIRDAVLIEEDGKADPFGTGHPARMRTLRTRQHRLTLYHGLAEGELYDLDTDPNEDINLWHEPAARQCRDELVLQLLQEMMRVASHTPRPTAAA
jgi:arylsulfatase A-like enzyme